MNKGLKRKDLKKIVNRKYEYVYLYGMTDSIWSLSVYTAQVLNLVFEARTLTVTLTFDTFMMTCR